MTSRIPPVSPASIMLVVRSSNTTGYWRMALARVAPPSTVVRTPVRRLLECRVLLVCGQDLQTLDQRQAGIDHDRELAKEDRDVFGFDLSRSEGRHREFFAFFANGSGRDAFAAQRLRQRLFIRPPSARRKSFVLTRLCLKM